MPAPATPKPPPAATHTAEAAAPPARKNPLLEPSPLPFHFPQFDKIKDADFAPAFEAGMAEQLKEVAAIAHELRSRPRFENTIVAMEKTGRLLTRVEKIFFNLNASNTDDTLDNVDPRDGAEALGARRLDPARPRAVRARRRRLPSSATSWASIPSRRSSLNRYEDMFVRAGARLSKADKARLKKINQQLSSLSTQFRQNVLEGDQGRRRRRRRRQAARRPVARSRSARRPRPPRRASSTASG